MQLKLRIRKLKVVYTKKKEEGCLTQVLAGIVAVLRCILQQLLQLFEQNTLHLVPKPLLQISLCRMLVCYLEIGYRFRPKNNTLPHIY